MSNNENRRAPSGVNYANLLPLGTRGTAKARRFMPNNGDQFTASNNIIRIPLNSTGFLDTEHSYLTFDVSVTSAVAVAANVGIKLDGGANALIRRLRIEGSDGSELNFGFSAGSKPVLVC